MVRLLSFVSCIRFVGFIFATVLYFSNFTAKKASLHCFNPQIGKSYDVKALDILKALIKPETYCVFIHSTGEVGISSFNNFIKSLFHLRLSGNVTLSMYIMHLQIEFTQFHSTNILFLIKRKT